MENATIDIETVETKSSYRDCEELCLCLVLETSGRTFVCFRELAVPISLTLSGSKTPGGRFRQGYGVVLGGSGATRGEEVLWDSDLSTQPPAAGGQLCLPLTAL